ncbi:MAG: glycosyltransferase family 87 protein, partial [Pseudomonadales bacterium]
IYFAVSFGQNSLLTAALAGIALASLKERPVLAGVLIGLLSIKPQLAILFPLALFAARAWKPFVAAAVAAVLLLLASIAIFGWDTVPAFVANTKFARETMIDNGEVLWYAMPTALSAMLLAGASFTIAMVAHGVVAALAAVALYFVWRRDASTGLRAASLAVATLMASPYLWFYEITWLGIAIAGMTCDGLRRGWLRGERELLLVAWFLPLYMGLNRVTHFPPIGPFVLALLMLAILRRVHVITRRNPDWLP